eukprot:CAMPEP_0183353012 /NCGR_PEP_ID=MMETSP0164_2-20130417/32095_1 /TAXON_ID=221442 /ORGANISM="Coccolithus pelagicus ssp braarudi, Strain PLY182g" /LENGTH=30 /DNA_ID= /DNA_START= /DNA_END= /DNA_ORIENTATION=
MTHLPDSGSSSSLVPRRSLVITRMVSAWSL